MALAASGAISFANLRDEFSPGSNTSISFSDYYRQGSKIKAKAGNNNAVHLAANVPTSGAIDISDFYSTARGFQYTYTSNATNQNLSTVFGNDYAVDYPKFIVINAGITVYSTSTSTAALNIASGGAGSITITNSGNIYGMGGAAGQAGGTALLASTSATLVNNSGANIKGGGGGGGNGGAGGVGSAAVAAQASSVTDKTGDKPDFVSYSPNTQFGPRAWSGIGSGEWGLNVQQGTSLRSTISQKGPVWYTFQVNTSSEYSLSANINNVFPENNYGGHYGNPVINISTAEDTKSQGQGGGDYGAGTSWTAAGWSGVKANLAANTTYYFCNYTEPPYGSSSPSGNFFYNNMTATLSLAVRSPSSGGSAGAGGVGQGFAQSAASGGSGGSGGSNAGSGGAGGAGGALGANGTAGSAGGNGSGTTISYPSTAPTNGSGGASGGAAGYYIYGNGNLTKTLNGTVAGNIA